MNAKASALGTADNRAVDRLTWSYCMAPLIIVPVKLEMPPPTPNSMEIAPRAASFPIAETMKAVKSCQFRPKR